MSILLAFLAFFFNFFSFNQSFEAYTKKKLSFCNSKKHCLYFCKVTEAKSYLNLKETITHK